MINDKKSKITGDKNRLKALTFANADNLNKRYP